ncbi:protein BatD [bacterium]|nr:protein BatD [bacterium]
MIKYRKKISSVGLIIIFAVSCLYGAQLSVKSYVDKNVIGVGDQFTLSVELSGKDAQKVNNPELPDLKEFAVFLGSGSSQNIQLINGKMSVTKTLQYHFQAVKAGSFTIGSVKVKVGGKTRITDTIPVRIVKNSGNASAANSSNRNSSGSSVQTKDLFLKVLPNKRRIYVNEPLVLTYKIYTRVNVSSFGFQKMPETTGFWVEDFTGGQSQAATSTEIINGIQYTVAPVKKMALFPMAAGIKTISPMVVVCSVRVRKRSRDVFDSFFDDPFGRQIQKSIASPSLKITVLPLPEEGKPSDFSGITGNYVLSSTVDKRSVSANEAVTFKIIIKGSGNLKAFPEPAISFPAGFEAYPPKVSQKISLTSLIVHGTKTFEYVLIPRNPGIQNIPMIRIPVFNPAKRKYEILSAPAITLNVAKSRKSYENTVHTGLTKEEVKLVGQDIRFIKTECPVFKRVNSGTFNILFYIMVFLPIIGIGCAYLYRKHLDRLSSDEAYAREHRSGKIAKKRLVRARSAVQENNEKIFYDEAGRALVGFAADKLNIPEAGFITNDVKIRLKKRGIADSTIKEYFDCISVCDMKRFSPEKSSVKEMNAFLLRAEKAIDSLSREL